MMMIEKNPFLEAGNMAPEDFCDREQESKVLIRSMLDGHNMVVVSPRRMGKRGLISYVFQQPQIKEHFYTFLIDVLHTAGSCEFAYVLCRKIYHTLLRDNPLLAHTFLESLTTVRNKADLQHAAHPEACNLQIGDFKEPEKTIEEVFNLFAQADRPCIVAINEIQQIAKHPEKRFDAILRAQVHKAKNCLFIFGGSDKRVVHEMFLSADHPFFLCADMMELHPIPKQVYVPYVVNLFQKNGRTLSADDVEKVYNFFEGYTGYMQKLFFKVFSRTRFGETCSLELLREVVDEIIFCSDTVYREVLSNYSSRQKQLLYAIAQEGVAKRLTSNHFIKHYSLGSASAVQSSCNILLERDLIMEYEKSYILTDRLFALWIKRLYGDETTL